MKSKIGESYEQKIGKEKQNLSRPTPVASYSNSASYASKLVL